MQKNVKKLRKNLEKVKCSSYLCIGFRKEPWIHASYMQARSIYQAYLKHLFSPTKKLRLFLPDIIRRSINPARHNDTFNPFTDSHKKCVQIICSSSCPKCVFFKKNPLKFAYVQNLL